MGIRDHLHSFKNIQVILSLFEVFLEAALYSINFTSTFVVCYARIIDVVHSHS